MGCDGVAEQEDFTDEASAPSAGITQTTNSGEVVGTDSDDWRQAPLFAGQFYVRDPAFPNPVTRGADGVVTLSVQVRFDDVFRGGLRVSARAPADSPCYQTDRSCFATNLDVHPEAQRAGLYTFQLSVTELGQFGPGLVRVLVLTADGAVASYGDVLVQ
jgi:hypothetical protein